MVTIDFNNWLIAELKDRGWSIRELARRAKVSHATINGVLVNKSDPGPDLCNGLARALGTPPERVFRIAGLLPAQIIGDENSEQEILDYYRDLGHSGQRQVLTIVRALYESRAEYSIKKQDQE